jgi:protein-S-isoprenylcysteine O-methyltransferase Ste14
MAILATSLAANFTSSSRETVPALSVSFMRCAGIGRDALSGWVASGLARSVVIRLLAAVWFLLLSAASVHSISGQTAEIVAGRTSFGTGWPALLSQGCIFVFYTIIFCIIILRPEPVSRAKGVRPALLALAGSYGPWLIPLLPRGPQLPVLAVASTVILLVSAGLMVYPLTTLGKSFSMMPQARKLVTRGPYAVVRHPLYLIEEAAIAGVLLQYAWYAALPFLAVHFALQIRRMQLEEKVLRKAFPEYAAYAKRTPRLIPGVW